MGVWWRPSWVLTMVNYYDILELDRKCTDKEIKKAYRRLALEFHPDRNQGDELAAEQFKLILEAYETLSVPKKRRRYDNANGSIYTLDGLRRETSSEEIFKQAGGLEEIFGSAFVRKND